MREDEAEALADADRALDEKEAAADKAEECDKLIKVFEAIFLDLNENFTTAARDCRNNDASTALGEAASAIDMMDIPFIIREALGVPHTTLFRS